MANEKEILEQAKTLIIKKQYDEARQVLLPIKNNPTAQKWLGKLDEVAPVKVVPPEPVSQFAPPPATLPEEEKPSNELPEPVSPIRPIQPPSFRPEPAAMDEEEEADFEPVSIEQLRPKPRPVGLDAETPEDRSRFERAKELFAQAQTILREMPGNKRANRWIRRVDNIDRPIMGERFFDAGPGATPQQRMIHFINEGKSAQTRSDLRNFLYSDNFRYLVGGVAIFAALMIILGFFIFSWVEIGRDSLTPTQIWLGTNDTYGSLDLTKFDEDTGFGDVRLIDRLLILILPLALGLGAIGWLYLQKKLPMRTALLALVMTAFILLIFGFFWRTLSTNSWKGNLKEQFGYDDLSERQQDDFDERLDEMIDDAKSYYSTGEHEFYSFIAFVVAFGGFVLLFADERGLLDEDYL